MSDRFVPTGVAVVVTDERGRCLLGQRLKNGSHGLMGLPGGSLEHGESFDTALNQCAFGPERRPSRGTASVRRPHPTPPHLYAGQSRFIEQLR